MLVSQTHLPCPSHHLSHLRSWELHLLQTLLGVQDRTARGDDRAILPADAAITMIDAIEAGEREIVVARGIETQMAEMRRTPDALFRYAETAAARGIKVIIAGAGGAAHLPGMCAAKTALPVLGVPVQSRVLNGVDSLLSIVQMPAGIPVGTLAIGTAGAINAGLLAAAILALQSPDLAQRLADYRARQTDRVLASADLSDMS